jgi:NAD(P)-dependent dehydrogenase (short-subunit alcohol dehydrogenase family)
VDLAEASVLVTGAGRGIGRTIALALARERARLTVVARSAAELDSLVGEIEASGGQGVAFAGDVRSASACTGAVAAAVERFGGLSALVNNAGVGAFANVQDTTDEAWEDVIGTNLTAVFRLTRAAIPHLAQRGGQILMISSLAGQNPIAGMAAYCASKAALDHFARCLMLEVRYQRVKVTVVAPGSVDTSFRFRGSTASGTRLGADDVAETVLGLLKTRDDAHVSRVEMRPLRPQKQG